MFHSRPTLGVVISDATKAARRVDSVAVRGRWVEQRLQSE